MRDPRLIDSGCLATLLRARRDPSGHYVSIQEAAFPLLNWPVVGEAVAWWVGVAGWLRLAVWWLAG